MWRWNGNCNPTKCIDGAYTTTSNGPGTICRSNSVVCHAWWRGYEYLPDGTRTLIYRPDGYLEVDLGATPVGIGYVGVIKRRDYQGLKTYEIWFGTSPILNWRSDHVRERVRP